MKKFTFQRITSIFFSSLMFYVSSCSKYTDSHQPIKQSNSQYSLKSSHELSSYSERELFKGIMFLDGPVVDEIKTLEPYKLADFLDSRSKLDSIRDIYSEICDTIAYSDSSYFKRFRTKILSGNHLKIKSALDSASIVVRKELKKIAELNEATEYLDIVKDSLDCPSLNVSDYKNAEEYRDTLFSALDSEDFQFLENEMGNGQCICFNFIGLVVVALALVAVVAIVAFYIVVYNEIGFWDGVSTGGGGSSLMINDVIDEIALMKK